MGNVGGNKNVATINSDFLENGQAIAVGSQSGFVMKKTVMFGRSDITVTVSWVICLVKTTVHLLW